MTAKKSKTPPDKRRKYDDAFKAEALRLASESRSTQAAAQQLGISPKLLYRWHQAQLVAEVGSVEVARDPEVRALRARLKRAERYSRKVVGWDVRETMPEDLVSEALRRALAVRQPAAGLVVHSDQGSQYAATNFKALLARHEAVQSMSRRGNCYDNAHTESFWSRLKTELLDGGSFRNLREAQLEISHYFAYYNAERRHSSLGYLAPITSKPTFKPRPNSVRLD